VGLAIDIAETPDLRFRRQDHARLCVVLAISAASMGFAYLGFERVSEAGALYRRSVSRSRSRAQHRPRADLVPGAGAILCGDRQEDDARGGGAGGGSQPEKAIDQSMKGTTNPERLDQVTRLAANHQFHEDLDDILKVKDR